VTALTASAGPFQRWQARRAVATYSYAEAQTFATTEAPATQTTPSNAAEELTAELNAVRVRFGLAPLTTDAGLTNVSQSWSYRMASTGVFAHGGGEQVIAMGQRSAREVIADWLASPGHRAWLLTRNAASVGWGVATGRNGQLYWAGAFGGGVVTTESTTTQTTQTFAAQSCVGGQCGAVEVVPQRRGGLLGLGLLRR